MGTTANIFTLPLDLNSCQKTDTIGNNSTCPSDSHILIVFLFVLFSLLPQLSNGPAVSGVLFEMEQPPEQFGDSLGPFESNRGILRHDLGLRQHLH